MSQKRILIVNNENDPKLAQLIRSICGDGEIKVDQVDGNGKVPEILSVEDQKPIFHTIYNLKSTANWPVSEIVIFVENGGNFFTGAASDSKLLNEFGLDPIKGSFFPNSNPKAQWNSKHAFSTIESESESKSLSFSLPESTEAIAFKLRNNPKIESNFNPLIQNAISFAPGSAICTSNSNSKRQGEEGACQSNSHSVSLLATLESRKGSRFAVFSSQKLLSSLPESTLKGIFGWAQGTRFYMKIASISHELTSKTSNLDLANRGKTDLDSTIYRVNDHINVRMCLSNGHDSRFIPEKANDFQFELKMMNIQLRKCFDSIDADGCLTSVNIQLPPKSAVYTLKISHNRPGWSQLSHNEKLLVRPFRHNEFPRFLTIAAPYYVSWIGILVASYFILLPSLFKQLK